MAPSGGKVSKKSPIFFQPFRRAPGCPQTGADGAQKFRTLFEKIGKIESDPKFFGVKNISHMRNFDTIPLAVRTVDGEILSEIAIHNFEKNRQIETRIVPNGDLQIL